MKKDNRGGKRPGAGQPKHPRRQFSDDFIKSVLTALKSRAEGYGWANPFEAFADLALNPEHPGVVRASAWKIIADMNVVKRSEQSVSVEVFDKPQVYLPEPMAKPVEAVEKERKAAEACSRMH